MKTKPITKKTFRTISALADKVLSHTHEIKYYGEWTQREIKELRDWLHDVSYTEDIQTIAEFDKWLRKIDNDIVNVVEELDGHPTLFKLRDSLDELVDSVTEDPDSTKEVAFIDLL